MPCVLRRNRGVHCFLAVLLQAPSLGIFMPPALNICQTNNPVVVGCQSKPPERTPVQKVEKLFRRYDKDGSGDIDFHEFLKLIMYAEDLARKVSKHNIKHFSLLSSCLWAHGCVLM